jgi:hypothetical protein
MIGVCETDENVCPNGACGLGTRSVRLLEVCAFVGSGAWGGWLGRFAHAQVAGWELDPSERDEAVSRDEKYV